MALKTSLDLRLRTGLETRLSAHQQQSLWLLRLSPLELHEELSRLAAANPLLRYLPPPMTGSGADDDSLDRIEAAAVSLPVSLMRQIAAQRLEPDVARRAMVLVTELRADGYLDADVLEPDDPLDAPALAALQACEPTGVGARSLEECLSLQLQALGLDRDAARTTLAHLPLFARRDWPALSRALGLDERALRARADLVAQLRPTPATETAVQEAPLVADLVLTRGADGVPQIALAEKGQAQVDIDGDLLKRARAQGFGEAMIAQAEAVIAALSARRATLVRIGVWLLERHGEALARGQCGPRPATQRQAAQDLSLSPSTISRAVRGKAIDIDGRLFPVSRFFTGASGRQDDEISGKFIQQRIAALVAAEPAGAPLSDESIRKILLSEGVDIARRTVAKYRQSLRIPTSRARRRRGAGQRS